jgi:hypothetical protein
MSPAVNDLASFDNEYDIRLLNSLQSVSDGQHSRASRRPLKAFLKGRFAGSIESAGTLIKKQQTWTTDKSASDCETLSLAT